MRLTNRHIVWNIVIAGIEMLVFLLPVAPLPKVLVKTDSTNKAKITPVNTATLRVVINNKPLPTGIALQGGYDGCYTEKEKMQTKNQG